MKCDSVKWLENRKNKGTTDAGLIHTDQAASDLLSYSNTLHPFVKNRYTYFDMIGKFDVILFHRKITRKLFSSYFKTDLGRDNNAFLLQCLLA